MAAHDGEHHVREGTVAVLTFSRIVRDRRVLRQCALLNSMGFSPLVIAYGEPGDTIAFPLSQWPVPRPTCSFATGQIASWQSHASHGR
jgi:hypothetical protein